MSAKNIIVCLSALLLQLYGSLAKDCPNSPAGFNFTCPPRGGFYCEGGSSLSSNIIIRCLDGCPYAGNCDDDLFCYPAGTGDKRTSLCYEDSAEAGNAQCTDNCVNATKTDGEVFYPMGCISSLLSTYTPFVQECATIGTKGATLGVPSGFITGSGTLTASKTANAGGAPGSSRVSGLSTPSPTSSSNAALGHHTTCGERRVSSSLWAGLLALLL